MINRISFVILSLLISALSLTSIQSEANESMRYRVVLATANWAPYYAPTLPKGGAVTEIAREAFRRVGYELEVVWVPWTRAMEKAKEGEYDGVLGAWYTEDRALHFTYSKPFFRNEIVFFKRRGDSIDNESLNDLTSYRIGVTKNSGPHEWLKDEYPDNLDLVGSAELNIMKLMAHRFDLMADEKLGVLYILNNKYPEWKDDIVSLEPPLQIDELHVIISKQNKDHDRITSDFDRGLGIMRADGTFDNILAKHGFSSDNSWDNIHALRK